MLVYFFFGRVFDRIGGDWVKVFTKSPPISKWERNKQGLIEVKVQQEKVVFRNYFLISVY
jgi:hypothetical protein